MKRFLLIVSLALSAASFGQITTYPYFEDFESGQNGWVEDNTTSGSWALGTPSNTVINSASSGSNAWITNLTTNYSNNDDSWVESPVFDFSGLSGNVQVSMDVWWNSEFSWDGANLMSSIDGGLSWQLVGTQGTGTNWYNDGTIGGNPGGNGTGWTGRNSSGNGSGAWVTASHDLDPSLNGVSDVRFRVNFGSDGSAFDDGFAFDNFAILPPVPYEAELVAISSPSNGCGLTSTEQVIFEVDNNGGDTIFTLDLCYVLDAGVPVCETFNDTILPGSSLSYTFSSTVDLSMAGIYNLDGYITLAGDPLANNDSIMGYSIENYPLVSGGFPYLEDFEAGQGGWTINNSNGGNWEFGTPSNTIINSAESGTNAFATGINSNYPNGMNDYVESPCFDFTAATGQEVFAMDVWWESENSYDGANVTYTLDGGATWQLLGSVGGAQPSDNWYTGNSFGSPGGFGDSWVGRNGSGSDGWVQSKWDLDSATFAGNFVKFRVNFGSDGSVSDEGFAFDNVAIAYPIVVDIYPDSMNICDTSFATNLSSLGLFDDAVWSDGQDGLDVELDFSGTYDVIAYDVYGMCAMDTFILVLNENFIAPDLGPDRVLCFGDSETLDAGSDTGNVYTYLWNDASTDTTLFVNTGGVFSVTKSDTAGCSYTDSVNITMPAPAELGLNTQGFCTGDSITLDPGIMNAQSYQWSTGASSQTITVSTVGGYSVVVIDSLGCSTIDAVSVLESVPMPDLGNDPTVLCVNTNTTLDPGTFDAYSWSTGDNTQTILVQGSVLGLGNHTFSVTVVDSLGCLGSASVTVQFEECVGIDELNQAQLSIYPNPSADGVFNYEVEGLSGEFNLFITDITGKTISNLDNTNNVVGVIDLSTFERGVYFLNIVANGDRKTVRLIKQ